MGERPLEMRESLIELVDRKCERDFMSSIGFNQGESKKLGQKTVEKFG